MRTYIDSYGSKVLEFDYPQDDVEIPAVKPSDVFSVLSTSSKFVTKYIRVNMSMDIETTTVDVNGEKYSVPYIITTSLQLPHTDEFYVIHTRNWKDTQDLYDEISKMYGVGTKYWSKSKKQYVSYGEYARSRRILLCFVHNLSYEFSFCRKEFKFADDEYGFFSKDSRKAMKATLADGIDLRDSSALTNSSLEQLSKMFTKHKKVKDLDYKKIRNTKTPLDDTERRYINDDVIILNEFEDVYFDMFCVEGYQPPLTNTARLLLQVRMKMAESGYDVKSIHKMQPSAADIDKEQKYLFRGGYVHGNINYLDETVEVLMRDITSSYPASMLMKYVPMSAFIPMMLPKRAWRKGDEPDEFKWLLANKCVKMTVRYYHLHTITEHSYESFSKLIEYFPYEDDETQGLDNGRIQKCEALCTMQTELDYEIYNLLYTWDAMEVIDIQYAERGMLPDFLLESVCGDYMKKNRLKVAGLSGTTDYALAKVNVNTYFGMCCKSIYTNSVKYKYDSSVWYSEEQDSFAIKAELDKRFLNYEWGVWITSQSRAKLVRMICAIEAAGGHVVYYDTDSIKYIPSGDGKTEELFEEENKRIAEERKNFPMLQDEAFGGKSGKGLGEWDSEHNDCLGRPDTVKFKTLGAKRYLYHCKDGEWAYDKKLGWYKPEVGYHLCVAGLPKVAVKYLPQDAFKFFSEYGFKFKGEDTGKLRPQYRDDEYEVTVTDDYGNSEVIKAKSGVSLIETDFDITSDKLYNVIMQKLEFRKWRRGF